MALADGWIPGTSPGMTASRSNTTVSYDPSPLARHRSAGTPWRLRHAPIAARAVRHPSRGLLPERRLVEPTAARDPGGRPQGRHPQGTPLAHRPTLPSRAIRARPPRRGAPDKGGARGCRTDPLRRLWRGDRGQGAGRTVWLARAGDRGRPLLPGLGMDVALVQRWLLGRDRPPARQRRLD